MDDRALNTSEVYLPRLWFKPEVRHKISRSRISQRPQVKFMACMQVKKACYYYILCSIAVLGILSRLFACPLSFARTHVL